MRTIVSIFIAVFALSSTSFGQVDLPKWKLEYSYGQTLQEQNIKYNSMGTATDTTILKGIFRNQSAEFNWFPGEFNENWGIIGGWKKTFDYVGDSLVTSTTQINKTQNRLDGQKFYGGLRFRKADDNNLVYSLDFGYFYKDYDYFNSTKRASIKEHGLFLAGAVSYYSVDEPWLSEIHVGLGSSLPLNFYPFAIARETYFKNSGKWQPSSRRLANSSKDLDIRVEVRPYRFELNNDVTLSPVLAFNRATNDFSLGSYSRNEYSIGVALANDLHSDFLKVSLLKTSNLIGFSVSANLAPLMRLLKK